MSGFQWAMLAVAVIGCLMTAGGVLGGCVWAVARIKEDVTDRINLERKLASEIQERHAAEIRESQEAQDHNFGETVMALRRFIETVEKEMHAIEIWGRDNYALKDDVKDLIGTLRDDIRTLGTEIKSDMRNLATKVDSKH